MATELLPAEATQTEESQEPKLLGVLAQFATVGELLAAARKMRDAGYEQLDAFSPFPVHGIDEALGLRRSRLPWIVLGAGLTGMISGLLLQWYTNAVDYPFLISGKPLFGLPAAIPVTFELTILFSAFATFLGMLALNRLPKLANPLFRSRAFRRVTTDGFFLLVPSLDAGFSEEDACERLESVGAIHTESIYEEAQPAKLPSWIYYGLVVLLALALVPPAIAFRARGMRSELTRLHPVWDMDYQAKFRTQTPSTFFADGRAMRPQVAGTVAWGELNENSEFYRGIRSSEPAAEVAVNVSYAEDQATENAAATASEEANAGDADPASQPPVAPEAESEPDWVTQFPLPVTRELMERGQERYNIYCAACHGLAGDGDGLVARRANELQQGTWVPPTSLHEPVVREQPIGRLFNTITHGIRKMPAYGAQIAPEDRWAIVLYLRALQRTRDAKLEEVPEEVREALRNVK